MSRDEFLGQLLVGLINGSFYALLSLGLSIIFGLLGIVNVAQGAFYMAGAFFSWMMLQWLGIGYWPALILAPLAVAAFGVVLEKTMIFRVYGPDHMPGLLLTLGLLMAIQGMFVYIFGANARPYPVPAELRGGWDLDFVFLPKYRVWTVFASVTVCFTTWFIIEKTSLGRTLRAANENPVLTRSFGINVPALITMGFALGVALAGFAGVLAAPLYTVSPLMGVDLIIIVFAVVVVGGLGSIFGAIITSLGLGVIEGFAKVFYPQGSNMVIFIVMIIVLLIKPAGLFGSEK
jgi:branched-chain amino acid transport system permease protein